MSPLRRAAASLRESFAAGGRAATGGSAAVRRRRSGASAPGRGAPGPPAWAQRMKRNQTINRGVTAADHAIRSGDRPSGGSSVDLSEGE